MQNTTLGTLNMRWSISTGNLQLNRRHKLNPIIWFHNSSHCGAMKFFRAQLLRPGYNEVEQGVNKSKDAIENCLCRDGFTFDGMKEVSNI